MEKKIYLIIGMAGTGKTTFANAVYSWISSKKMEINNETGTNKYIYTINLDPAVENTKMPVNLDIRDKIDFREIMEKYNMGPNGAILTSLNLFLLNMECINTESEYIIIDTPGQIEAFISSGAGIAIVDYFRKIGNLKIFYVVDSLESKKHLVFMNNMMYAASIKCRYNSDVVVVFNKTDLANLNEYMDYEKFRSTLPDEYYSPLLSSMVLHFEEFYSSIPNISISCFTNYGKDDFIKKYIESNQ